MAILAADARFGGRVFKTMGDGALAEFASAYDALHSAVEVQRQVATRNAGLPEQERIEFRIGISLGDVIVEGGDLYGNGVNVAARMEGLAAPGGILAGGQMWASSEPAGEKKFIGSIAQNYQPVSKRRADRLCYLESDRSASLLLEDGGAFADAPASFNVTDTNRHQITIPELAVDRQIEEGEIPC